MRALKTVPAMLLNTLSHHQHRTMVNLYGPAFLSAQGSVRRKARAQVVMNSSLRVENMEPPPNPSTLLTEAELRDKVDLVRA